jgi:hypothetical protein
MQRGSASRRLASEALLDANSMHGWRNLQCSRPLAGPNHRPLAPVPGTKYQPALSSQAQATISRCQRCLSRQYQHAAAQSRLHCGQALLPTSSTGAAAAGCVCCAGHSCSDTLPAALEQCSSSITCRSTHACGSCHQRAVASGSVHQRSTPASCTAWRSSCSDASLREMGRGMREGPHGKHRCPV